MATAHNTGTLALATVTLAMRGEGGLVREPAAAGAPGTRGQVVQGVAVGAALDLRLRFVAPRPGTYRVSASGREERGWAAGGAWLEVVAVAAPEPAEPGGQQGGRTLLLGVAGEALDPVEAGASFRYRTTLRNLGDEPLTNVTWAWRGGSGMELAEGVVERLVLPRIEPGETRTLALRFVAPRSLEGGILVSCSAREDRGWTAAGSILHLSP